MLQKRIDIGSIPYGTAVAGEDITKGALVYLSVVDGVEVAKLADTTNAPVGFAYRTIRDEDNAQKAHDVIKSGERLVIYTLNKNNVWGTSVFTASDSLVKGAYANPGAGGTIEYTASDNAMFEVFEVHPANTVWNDAMIDVRVLRTEPATA